MIPKLASTIDLRGSNISRKVFKAFKQTLTLGSDICLHKQSIKWVEDLYWVN